MMITDDDYGIIYVMRILIPNINDVYKIGYCSENKSRLGEYTKLPYGVKYSLVYYGINKKEHEKILHDKFSSKRMKGEWFHLNQDNLDEIKAYLEDNGYQLSSDGKHDKESTRKKTVIPSYNYQGTDDIYMAIVDQDLNVKIFEPQSFKYTKFKEKENGYYPEQYCKKCGCDEFMLKDADVNKNYGGKIVCVKCGTFIRKGERKDKEYFTPYYTGKYGNNDGKYYPELGKTSLEIMKGSIKFKEQYVYCGYTEDECLNHIKNYYDKKLQIVKKECDENYRLYNELYKQYLNKEWDRKYLKELDIHNRILGQLS